MVWNSTTGPRPASGDSFHASGLCVPLLDQIHHIIIYILSHICCRCRLSQTSVLVFHCSDVWYNTSWRVEVGWKQVIFEVNPILKYGGYFLWNHQHNLWIKAKKLQKRWHDGVLSSSSINFFKGEASRKVCSVKGSVRGFYSWQGSDMGPLKWTRLFNQQPRRFPLTAKLSGPHSNIVSSIICHFWQEKLWFITTGVFLFSSGCRFHQ